MERATEKERERGRTCSAGSSYSCDVTKISAVRFAIGLPAFAEFNIEHSHALSRKHHANPTNRTLLSYLSRHIEEKSKKKRNFISLRLYDSIGAASTKKKRLHSAQVLWHMPTRQMHLESVRTSSSRYRVFNISSRHINKISVNRDDCNLRIFSILRNSNQTKTL